jgi:hypothetical protein
MKTILVPIQNHLIHGFDQVGLVERGKIIQEHFDELSIELLMP